MCCALYFLILLFSSLESFCCGSDFLSSWQASRRVEVFVETHSVESFDTALRLSVTLSVRFAAADVFAFQSSARTFFTLQMTVQTLRSLYIFCRR